MEDIYIYISGPQLPSQSGATPCGVTAIPYQLGRTAGVLLVLAYIAVGIALRGDTGLNGAGNGGDISWKSKRKTCGAPKPWETDANNYRTIRIYVVDRSMLKC